MAQEEEKKTVLVTQQEYEIAKKKVEDVSGLLDQLVAESDKPSPNIKAFLELMDQVTDIYSDLPPHMVGAVTALTQQDHRFSGERQEKLDKMIPHFEAKYKQALANAKKPDTSLSGTIASPLDVMNQMIEKNGKICVGDAHNKTAMVRYMTENMDKIKGDTFWVEFLDYRGKPFRAYLGQEQAREEYLKLIEAAKKSGKKVVGIDQRTDFTSNALRLAITNYRWLECIGKGSGVIFGGFGHYIHGAPNYPNGYVNQLTGAPVFMNVQGPRLNIMKMSKTGVADFIIYFNDTNAPTQLELRKAMGFPDAAPAQEKQPEQKAPEPKKAAALDIGLDTQFSGVVEAPATPAKKTLLAASAKNNNYLG